MIIRTGTLHNEFAARVLGTPDMPQSSAGREKAFKRFSKLTEHERQSRVSAAIRSRITDDDTYSQADLRAKLEAIRKLDSDLVKSRYLPVSMERMVRTVWEKTKEVELSSEGKSIYHYTTACENHDNNAALISILYKENGKPSLTLHAIFDGTKNSEGGQAASQFAAESLNIASRLGLIGEANELEEVLRAIGIDLAKKGLIVDAQVVVVQRNNISYYNAGDGEIVLFTPEKAPRPLGEASNALGRLNWERQRFKHEQAHGICAVVLTSLKEKTQVDFARITRKREDDDGFTGLGPELLGLTTDERGNYQGDGAAIITYVEQETG